MLNAKDALDSAATTSKPAPGRDHGSGAGQAPTRRSSADPPGPARPLSVNTCSSERSAPRASPPCSARLPSPRSTRAMPCTSPPTDPTRQRLAMRRLLTSDDQWDTVDKRLKVWPWTATGVDRRRPAAAAQDVRGGRSLLPARRQPQGLRPAALTTTASPEQSTKPISTSSPAAATSGRPAPPRGNVADEQPRHPTDDR